MTRYSRFAASLSLFSLLAGATGLEAQQQQGEEQAPAAEESTPASYVYARGGSKSIGWVFYTYTFANKLTPLIGTAQEFHRGAAYTEYIGALGATFYNADGSLGLMPFVGYSRASDSQYLVGYLFSALNRWNLDASALVFGYAPLESQGVQQLWLDPVLVYYKLGTALGVGGAYSLTLFEGAGPAASVGPSLRYYLPILPGSNLSADYLRPWVNHVADFRLTLQLIF